MANFFKPTTTKIILAFIIPVYLAIIAIPSASESSYQYLNIGGRFVFLFTPFVFFLLNTVYIWAINENYFAGFSSVPLLDKLLYFFTEAVIPLIINYLLACLIIYFYNWLFRNKKGKR